MCCIEHQIRVSLKKGEIAKQIQVQKVIPWVTVGTVYKPGFSFPYSISVYMWLISPIMALWSWKALLRFSRCWLWKGPVRSRCSAGEQPGQQVAWKEQVRQEPRAAQQYGVGCQAGLAGSPQSGILGGRGWVRGVWPGPSSGSTAPAGPRARGCPWRKGPGKGWAGAAAALLSRATSCAVCRLDLCPGSPMPPPARENVLSTLQKWISYI